MKVNLMCRWAAILLAGFLFSGCGSAETTTATTGTSGEAAPDKDIKTYAADKLPPVDRDLLIEQAGLQIAAPEGWAPFRKTGYIVVYSKKGVNDLPRVSLSAKDSPYSELGDTSEENAPAFQKAIQGQLRKERRDVREPVKPLILGDHVWLRHVRQVPFNNQPCAVQSLQTVHHRRLFTIELICAAKGESAKDLAEALTKNKNEYRDAAYAIAANIKFTAGGGETTFPVEKPAEEKPPETKPDGAPTPAPTPPAETKPAEVKPAEPNPEAPKGG